LAEQRTTGAYVTVTILSVTGSYFPERAEEGIVSEQRHECVAANSPLPMPSVLIPRDAVFTTSEGAPSVADRRFFTAMAGAALALMFLGLPIPGLALFGALVLAPALRDFWRRSTHRWLSLSVGLAIVGSVVLRVPVGMTGAWRAFAAWLVG
jgi:hypothetical protein